MSDEPVELDLDIRHVTGRDRDLLRRVVRLADAHRRTLGFLTPVTFEEAADCGTLLAALVGGTLAGYSLYSLPRQVVRLKHLCVAGEFRGRGIARALVDRISDEHKGRFGIVARCRNDYAENAMWPHLGFEARGEVIGRSRQRLPLTVWWRDHGHPDLFSSSDSTTALKVAIDLNVFLDLEVRATDVGLATSQALNQDWLAGQIDLVVTSELVREIGRLPDGESRDRQRRMANRYARLQVSTSPVDEISRRIIDHIRNNRGIDLSLDKGDRSDVRHIAEASAVGVPVFATRDERLLEWGPEAIDISGVHVLHPSSVVLRVDELTRAQVYQPAELQNTEYTLVSPRAESEAVLTTFLCTDQGERRSDFLLEIRRFSAEAQRWERRLLQDPSGRPVAFYITGDRGSELSIPILRVSSRSIGDTITRQILFLIRQQARSLKTPIIRITDRHVSPVVSTALRDEDFLHLDDCWVGFCINQCADAEAIEHMTSTAAETIDLCLPTLRPRLSPVVAAGLERALWPAKILDSELPHFIVPIHPAWSAGLFDVPQTLTRRPNRLGISREHVYYRSPRPRREHAPARLLWYVTDRGASGLSAIIGCSRLEELVVDKPVALYARFRHLGVWQRHHVEQASRGGQALALRFADTELFPQQVTLEKLRGIAARFGHNLVLRSPQKIPSALFGTIYREGWTVR